MEHAKSSHSTTLTRQASSVKTADRQVNKIHIDQSPKGAYLRARKELSSEDSDAITSGMRLRIINVWKPIVGPVLDHPICFADSQSIRQKDLVPVEQIYPDYIGETYALKRHPCQKFYYRSKMGPEDILLLQCFDSSKRGEDGSMEYPAAAHGCFELDDSGNESCNRFSVEVRCLVLG